MVDCVSENCQCEAKVDSAMKEGQNAPIPPGTSGKEKTTGPDR